MRAKTRSNIQGQYLGLNIPIEIIRSAEMRGLDAMATGGGCDYITRALSHESNGPRMVLGAADDAGSPDTLTERANITLYFNDENWSDGGYISFNFDTTVDALDFMAGFNDCVVDMFRRVVEAPVWTCGNCHRKNEGSRKTCKNCGGERHRVGMVDVAKRVLGLFDDPEQDRRASESGRRLAKEQQHARE